MKKKYIHQEVPTGPDTICHLKLYDGSAFDYSLNGNYGTLKGTAHYTYPGVDLDGDSDYIEIADDTVFSPLSTSISISAWIYMDTGAFIIVSKGVAALWTEYVFYTDGANKLQCWFGDDDGDYIGRKYDTALSTGQWYHVVATYTNDTDTSADVKLYLNGVKVDDTNKENNPAGFSQIDPGTGKVLIGRQDINFTNGKIDDVIITKSVLSATEVRSIYELTRWRYQV